MLIFSELYSFLKNIFPVIFVLETWIHYQNIRKEFKNLPCKPPAHFILVDRNTFFSFVLVLHC